MGLAHKCCSALQTNQIHMAAGPLAAQAPCGIASILHDPSVRVTAATSHTHTGLISTHLHLDIEHSLHVWTSYHAQLANACVLGHPNYPVHHILAIFLQSISRQIVPWPQSVSRLSDHGSSRRPAAEHRSRHMLLREIGSGWARDSAQLRILVARIPHLTSRPSCKVPPRANVSICFCWPSSACGKSLLRHSSPSRHRETCQILYDPTSSAKFTSNKRKWQAWGNPVAGTVPWPGLREKLRSASSFGRLSGV